MRRDENDVHRCTITGMRLSLRLTLVFVVGAAVIVGLLSGCAAKARTHLTIVASRGIGEFDYWVSCDPPRGNVRHPAAICARISVEPRFATAKPGRDHSCPSDTPGVRISGVLAGKRVSNVMSGCREGSYAGAWASYVGLPLYPLERTSGNASGGSGVGNWNGARGIEVTYHEGGTFAVVFTLKNVSDTPMTISRVYNGGTGPALVQLIGVRIVHFLLPKGDLLSTTMQRPFGPLPALRPVLIRPHERAQVQENFRMGNCRTFRPGSREVYNRRVILDLTWKDGAGGEPIALKGDQLTITVPVCRAQ